MGRNAAQMDSEDLRHGPMREVTALYRDDRYGHELRSDEQHPREKGDAHHGRTR